MSYARIYFYECAENLLSFARFNCAVFNYFYRLLGHLTGMYPAHNSNQKRIRTSIFLTI